jgi:hypothetical protein
VRLQLTITDLPKHMESSHYKIVNAGVINRPRRSIGGIDKGLLVQTLSSAAFRSAGLQPASASFK